MSDLIDNLMDWLGIGGYDDEGDYFWGWDDVLVWLGVEVEYEDFDEYERGGE